MLSRLVVITVTSSLLTAFSASTAISQTVTFSTTTYPYNLWNEQASPNGTIRADLNGDGREDFVTTNNDGFNSNCTGSFAITLSTGDGKYAAPVCYTLPSGNATLFAVGDFYDDGLLDVVVANDNGLLYMYENNGTGNLEMANTFQLEGIPAGMVAADINRDSVPDLIYVLDDPNGGPTNTLYTLLGDGGGAFTGPGPTTTFTMNKEPAWALSYGDFDNDSHTDILVEGVSQVEDEILYGDGTGHFTPGPIVGGTAPKYVMYSAFDIESDGTMDLIGAPFTVNPEGANTYYNTLDIEWGHYNRTLTSQTVTLKNCTASGAPPVIADFNGDGNNDIMVVEASDCKGDGPYTLNVLLGNGKGSFQSEEVVYSSDDWIGEWHVIRASHSSKPDLTLWQTQLVDGNEITNQQELMLVNTTTGNFPSCTPSNFTATGIGICSPTSSTGVNSPVTFSLASGGQALGRDMELWIDGVKVNENLKSTYSRYSFLNATVPLSAGQHTVTAYSVGWDYTLYNTTFPLYVGSSTCPPPASDGLNICSPIGTARGFSTVTSPVLAYASGNVSGAGNIVRMEVWVDGVKEYSTFGSNMLKTELTLPPGQHKFDYYIVGSVGDTWEDTVYANVK